MYDLHMSEPTYVERLRAIRDQINEELREVTWEEWEAQARQKTLRDPHLARLIEQATTETLAGTHIANQGQQSDEARHSG